MYTLNLIQAQAKLNKDWILPSNPCLGFAFSQLS